MHDTNASDGLPETPAPTASTENALPAPAAPPPDGDRALRHAQTVRFTGSGSEYFRIWIVNLALTIVTLGFYYPWAKARRLRYFHGNTLVGDEPLGFHGDPRRMLRGYLLSGLLFALYSGAGLVSPIASLLAIVVIAVLMPALLRAAMQFRLSNTSWRGLHMHFSGSLQEIYGAMWAALGAAIAALGLAMLLLYGGLSDLAKVLVPLLILLPLYAVVIWLFWRFKKYQHDHYAWASLGTRFTVKARAFYGLTVRGLGMVVLAVLLAGALAGIAVWLLADGTPGARTVSLLPLAIVFGMFVLLKPWLIARLQNLVWRGTQGDGLQFDSRLRYRAMLALTLRNWLLIVVTLGLYWPFAAIAMARLRLEAVSLAMAHDPATLADRGRELHQGAAGDAAGDLFGFDIGW